MTVSQSQRMRNVVLCTCIHANCNDGYISLTSCVCMGVWVCMCVNVIVNLCMNIAEKVFMLVMVISYCHIILLL